MKTILITGGLGFVGRYLTAQLLSENVHITRLEKENDCNPFSQNHVVDICNEDEISNLIKLLKPDIIYHLAGQSSVALSWKKPQLTTDVNIKGAVNLLEAVKNFSAESKVLLIGSSEEYGRIENGYACETDKSNPENIYAVTKYAQEMLGKVYHNAYGLKTIMTRSFNHIGASQSPSFAVSDFCRQAVRIEMGLEKPVIKTGNLSAMRDFTDVTDITKAYIMLAETGKYGRVYNVGSGNAVSLQSILDIILSMTNADITVEIDSARFRPVDVPKIQADISLLQSDTGWKPLIPIEQTVKNMLDYWRKYENN